MEWREALATVIDYVGAICFSLVVAHFIVKWWDRGN